MEQDGSFQASQPNREDRYEESSTSFAWSMYDLSDILQAQETVLQLFQSFEVLHQLDTIREV